MSKEPAAPRMGYVVVQGYRKTEVDSGMVENDQPPKKVTETEVNTFFTSKREAEKFFNLKSHPLEGDADNGEVRRFLCAVQKNAVR